MLMRRRDGTTWVMAVAIALAAAWVAGSGSPAPGYPPSADNVAAFRQAGPSRVSVGAFTLQPGMKGGEAISLRVNRIVSPVGHHFGDYLSAALRSELQRAGLYQASSQLHIAGVLQVNRIEAGGFDAHRGDIEARFVVTRGGRTLYDEVKRIEHQWEGAFAAAIAIPAAAEQYPVMVQKLLAALASDAEFIASLREPPLRH